MKTWYWLIGVGLTVAFLIFYFIVASAGGFTGPESDWRQYGEPPVDGPIKQPISFWTDLAFILSGILALIAVDIQERTSADLPMKHPTFYSVPFGVIMVWMGPASMLEHGTLVSSWGWLDATSIHWYCLFTIQYILWRFGSSIWHAVAGQMGGPSGETQSAFRVGSVIVFHVVYIALSIGVVALTRSDSVAPKDMSIFLMSTLLGVVILSMLPTWIRAGGGGTADWAVYFDRDNHWWAFFIAFGVFALGMLFLFTSENEGPTAPAGHGIFHVCMGGTTFFIFMLLFNEEPRGGVRPTPRRRGSRK